jgi:enoyl-CoA hydratase/carnithine racemase
MEYSTILYEKADGIGRVTLNRPARLNAITPTMIQDLNRLLDEVMADAAVKVLLFTGAPRQDGVPCFCAGADIRQTTDVGKLNVFSASASALLNRIEGLEKPTMGVIDGICTAGGLELALVMDIRIASDTARISDVHIKNLGRLGGWGVQTRLCRTVGAARAKEILWTGIPLDGKEAWRIGLVNKVVSHDALFAEAMGLARTIACMREQAIIWSKKSINAALDKPTLEALQYEQYCADKSAEGISPGEAPVLDQWRGKESKRQKKAKN